MKEWFKPATSASTNAKPVGYKLSFWEVYME